MNIIFCKMWVWNHILVVQILMRPLRWWNLPFCGTFAFRGYEEAWGVFSSEIWDSSIQAGEAAQFPRVGSRRRSPRDFTSAAIRRDSQYAFTYRGVHSTAQKYKVCGVYWMEHGWSILSAHAPLKRVLGGGKGRLQQNSKAAFSCSISKLNFSGHVFLCGYGVSSINLNITPLRKHSGHAIPIWIPIFWSRVPVSQKRDMTRDTSFQSRRFDSDLKQHLTIQ